MSQEDVEFQKAFLERYSSVFYKLGKEVKDF